MATKRQHTVAGLMGGEPSVDHLDPKASNYTADIMRLFNWYSSEKKRTDSYKFHLDFVKKNRSKDDYKIFSTIDEKDVHITFGWVARIITRGGSIDLDQRERFESYLDGLIRVKRKEEVKEEQPVVVEPKKVVVNIQDAMKQKTAEYLGEVEGAIDSFIKEDTEFNLYNDLKARQIPAPYMSDIKDWAQKKLAEYNDVLTSKDSQIVEGYSNINKRKLKNIAKLFEQFVDDCDKYSQYKKANRKPRITKDKPPAVQVKNLKFKAKDDEYNLTSAKVTDIVGAEQVWVFNTKTRKLAVYTSESTKGMSVKGSSLQNWSPDKSKQKTLRKPEEQIKDLMTAGKVKLRSFINDIKAKEQAVNGRINIDTIILRIIR